MCPRIGKKYTTSLGAVKVLRSNFFKKTLSLLTENFDEKEVSIDEWNEIVNKPPSEEAMAEARSQAARGRRGGRKPIRPDAESASAMESEEVSPEILALEDKESVDGAQGGNQGQRRERPAKQPRQPRQAKAEQSGDDEGDAAKNTRRPRRRRRRPPKK
jgi:hypothetical protein